MKNSVSFFENKKPRVKRGFNNLYFSKLSIYPSKQTRLRKAYLDGYLAI